MSNTLCAYNSIHGSFNRPEIRMLAHALGLPEDRIEYRLNKLGHGETIQISKVILLLKQGAFITDLNLMFNDQSGLYNSMVLAKALQLVDSHLFSFHEIRKARLSFDFYEMNALGSDKNTFELISQAIKSCGYRISPLKLKHRLYHYHLNKIRILHLCEYFDLLLMSNRIDKKSESSSKKSIDIANPKSIDQQIIDELNAKYLHDEHNSFLQENFVKEKMIESSVWPAKIVRQNQMNEAAAQKARLQRQLTASISSLKHSRAGSACVTPSHSATLHHRQSRPTSTCPVTPSLPVIDRSVACSTAQSNRSMISEIETKTNEITNRLQQLQSESTYLVFKYAVYREDYMNELFPNGFTKSTIEYNEKPVLRRAKTAKPSMYWSDGAITKKNY
ncbi:unnamed protein product [Adineta steineri]|uniref:Uncharacterized protein n=1 Tax=Adineta steineri TaxID=433720 RepID=A0A819F3Q0_9BILA|nr:unnamed protein product [Adineta steineri]